MKRNLSAFVLVCAAALAPATPQGSPTPRARGAAQAGAATPARDEKLWKRALALHRKAVIVDGHNDIPT
ncbi:MAG TPA: hypothetical protein VGB98_11860, partial [Pyrinomonadaceae bacterium]